MSYLYIFGTIIFAVSSQLIIKWRMGVKGNLPNGITEKFLFLFGSLLDPFIMISIFLTLMSGISWMAAMTKFDISYAYPFISLSFILVLILSALLFNEPVNVYKIIGLIFIIIGIFISSR